MVNFSEAKTKDLPALERRQVASNGRSHQTESGKIRCHDKPRPQERQGYSREVSLVAPVRKLKSSAVFQIEIARFKDSNV